MKIEKLKLDSKGRIVLPHPYREFLNLGEGDSIFASLDERNTAIILTPYLEKDLFSLDIKMTDAPGTLAKLAKVFVDEKADLVSTESHSLVREKSAVWRVVCKINKKKLKTLIKKLKSKGAISVSYRKV